MLRNLVRITVLAVATAIPLVAGGCASDNSSNQPAQLTGSGQDRAAYDKFGVYHPDYEGKPWANPRFQDQKGHYHPDWVNATGR